MLAVKRHLLRSGFGEMKDSRKTKKQLIEELERMRRRVDESETSVVEHKMESEAACELAAIVEYSEDAIISMTLEGIITNWNPGAERLYGYSQEEARGKPLSIIIPPDQANELRESLEKIRQGKRISHYETERICKDGKRIVVSVSVSPVKIDGRVTGVTWIGRDITERKKAEAERERLLEHLRGVNERLAITSIQLREQVEEAERREAEVNSIISSMADGVIIYSPTGDIVRANPAAMKLLGYTSEDLRRPLLERAARLRPETPDGKPFPLQERATEVALRGEMIQGIVMVLHPSPNRTIWVSVSGAPIRNPSGQIFGAVVVITDITALHELQRERDEFAHTVSHDLRAPLAVVLGQIQIIQRYADRPDQVRKSADSILTAARRMNGIIQDLVDSARLEAGQLRLEKQPTDLGNFLADLLERTRGIMAVERVKLETPAELPPVYADPDRLERILINLLTNSLKYSPPETEVLVRAEKTDSEVKVSVSDRGIGIAPEDIAHIFERFYEPTAGRKAGGLGLGLYICRMLVEAHDGRIWLESELGKGSSFCFTLAVTK